MNVERKSGAVTGEPDAAVYPSNSRIARSPIFYGWIVMAAGTLGLFMI